jgi:hypothetical protein
VKVGWIVGYSHISLVFLFLFAALLGWLLRHKRRASCSADAPVRVPETRFALDHAAILYSWTSPPSTSRRRRWSRAMVADPGGGALIGGRWSRERWRAMFVVVRDVDREDAFEVPSVDDQDPVEALAADGADRPFDEGVRARCAYGCADRPDGVGSEHLVEPGCELAVAVVDQKPDRLRPVDERLDHVACLLGRPLPSRVRGDARKIDPPGGEFDKDECVQPPQQHGLDSKEVARDNPAGLGLQELPSRFR